MFFFVTKRDWYESEGFPGRDGFALLNAPDILLKSEYNYLIKHPSQLELWMESGGASGEMGKALSQKAGVSKFTTS